MTAVAFATCREWPEINNDELSVAELLDRRGIGVSAAVWDDPSVPWESFDFVVIRATWDYHLKADSYARWLGRFTGPRQRLWNSPAAILANMNKRYLVDLLERGLSVVPTHFQARKSGPGLAEVLARHSWDEAVVKPAISASAFETWRTSQARAAADAGRFSTQLERHDLLVQPYMPEIATEGEWSLVFFDGQYSHAVLKRPAAGDFRVQREFGGGIQPAEAAPSLIDQAQAFLATVDEQLLYARVDGVVREGRFVLMELEINEPFLCLGFASGAAERFAEAIARRIV